MGDFNTNFQDIANETKRLQKDHANARAAAREEQRKVDQIKAEMAELNMSKEVTVLVASCPFLLRLTQGAN